jgi:hypothetical protein
VDILERWSKEGSTEADDILESFKYQRKEKRE